MCKWVGFLLLVATLTFGKSALASTTAYSDTFSQSNGPVGYPWSPMSGSVGALSVENDALTVNTGGYAGIDRPITYSGPVTFSAAITQQNGYGGLQDRYSDTFVLKNNGILGNGYGLTFYRGDQTYNDSAVKLTLNGNLIAYAPSTYQFGAGRNTTVTVNTDGSISGKVTEGGSTFDFNFPAYTTYASLPGTQFGIQLNSGDVRSPVVTNPTVSNLGITYNTNVPLLPPTPTTTPSISAFPSQVQLLSGQASSFFTSFLNQVSPADQNWITAGSTPPTNTSPPLPTNLKKTFKTVAAAAKDVSGALGWIDYATFDPSASTLSGATTDLIKGIGALESTPQFRQAVDPSVSSGLALVGDGASTALTCASAVATAGAAINLDFYCGLNGLQTAAALTADVSDLIAKDPPDPNYRSVFIPEGLISTLPSVGGCTDLNAASQASLMAMNQSLNYEDALLVTSNRYGTALSASDANSAALQYMAFQNYLGLYDNSSQTANTDLSCFAQLLSANNLGTAVPTSQQYSELMAYLSANSSSSVLSNFFGPLGLNNTDIQSMIQDLVSSPPPLYAETPVSAINTYIADTSPSTSVPEPSSLLILCTGLLGLIVIELLARHRGSCT